MLSPGESIPLAVSGVQGDGVVFEWSPSAGIVTPPTGQTVNFTAPNNPGQVIIKVTAKRDGTSSEATIVCNIEVTPTPPPPPPTMTNTPTPTNTPAPTDTPTPIPPIACNHPSITGNVFPQLQDVDPQFPFYGPEDDPNFLCQGVYDIFHSEPLAVRIEYKSVDDNRYWGIGTPDGYDATKFTEICFWAYTQTPNQAFSLDMKDTSPREEGILINIAQAGKWTSFCTPLSRFSDLGVQLNRLENVNLQFKRATNSATVWVDDFEFK
ncbi:MAG TPA: hypothetical protein VJ793_26580 [Anaerolineae bacterium]|nr:hypothetical protein [Anaerolineae bacterium]